MAILTIRYPSKAAFVAAIRRGIAHRPIPGHAAESVPANGIAVIDEPPSPAPHRWYAVATLRAGIVIRAK